MSVQVGFLMPFAGTSVPSGWVSCEGQSLAVASYSDLYSAIGYLYGGSGANFNVPDLRDRTPVGQGGEFASGEVGGAKHVTLTDTELPEHTHTISVHATQLSCESNDPEGRYHGGGDTNMYTGDSPDVMMATNSVIAANTGSGGSFSIMNPYVGMIWCIAATSPN